MKKPIYVWIFALLLLSLPAEAQTPQYQGGYDPEQSLGQYFDAAYPQNDKSVIYVFFNNAPCYECPQTIDLIERIYDQYFADQYRFFIINYNNDDEYNFIETYDLNQPLEVVLARYDDGAAEGFKKLEGLQYQISDPVSFTDNFIYQVNNFLGNG